MILSDLEIKENIDGYFFYDCAVRDKESFSFLMFESIDDAANGRRRLINYFPNDPEGDRIGKMELTGFSRPIMAASLYPKNQSVVVASDCTVCVQGGGDGGMERPIPNGDELSAGVLRACFNLATIDGYIHAVGPWRTVCKRIGPNHWESLVGDRSTLPKPPRRGSSTDGGFDAIAGFHSNDLYCVGGKGDAWRYDGQRWYQCVVPTNMYFRSVCCAGDGFVYIGMQSGSVMRGREDSWEIIHRDEMTLAFKDMVWYGDKVWCTSDYGLWVIEEGKLKEADVPPEVKACSGNLSVGDGVMLLAGMYGATVFDGRNWQQIL
jgi:hypothetical protein